MRKILLLGVLFGFVGCFSSGAPYIVYQKPKEKIIINEVAQIQLPSSTPPKPVPLPPPPQSIQEPNGGGSPVVAYKRKPDEVDFVTQQLYSASMAFSVPETANIAEDITVQLLLDPSKDLKELEDNLTVSGNRTSKKVQISKIVIAKLTAPDFIVDNVTPDEQAVAQTAPTEWLWKLTPKSKGKHSIDLTITAVVKVDGKETKYHIKTYEKQIIIEVKPQQLLSEWFAKYWQWLFSTLVLPLGLWLYKRHKKE